MNAITTAVVHGVNYFATMGITDIIDIIIVAYLIYTLILLIRRTNLYNVAKGLVIFLLVMWSSDLLHLSMISFILRKAAELGLIALVILFQPELRRLLERVGSTVLRSSGKNSGATEMERAITETVSACADMSASRTGALLVFERKIRLNDIIASGTPVDSAVSAELIKNIFFNKAPLHDGALIIRNGRIAAAGCILPLTGSTNLSKELGMRHRAGIGMSEQSDALVLIVSEENGSISCSIDGSLKRHLTKEVLEELLQKELISAKEASGGKAVPRRMLDKLFGGEK